MHGQSADYTPRKQMQLTSLLEACRKVWQKSHSFASPERCFIDCMAGSGYDEQGNPGSPLIFQDYAKNFIYPVVAWCDKDRKFTNQLETYRTEKFVTILTGRYQDEVLQFIENVPVKAMGLVYLDDNGCKEVWNDEGFLRHVMSNYPFMDIAIHFSEHAWLRNERAGTNWAEEKHVMQVFELILHYKPESVIYAPRIRHHWRLVWGCRSNKMDLRGQQRIKLRDYMRARRESQMSLLEGIA
jgi:three-Cys-motif partner protein